MKLHKRIETNRVFFSVLSSVMYSEIRFRQPLGCITASTNDKRLYNYTTAFMRRKVKILPLYTKIWLCVGGKILKNTICKAFFNSIESDGFCDHTLYGFLTPKQQQGRV